jgi:hypothetical protein
MRDKRLNLDLDDFDFSPARMKPPNMKSRVSLSKGGNCVKSKGLKSGLGCMQQLNEASFKICSA